MSTNPVPELPPQQPTSSRKRLTWALGAIIVLAVGFGGIWYELSRRARESGGLTQKGHNNDPNTNAANPKEKEKSYLPASLARHEAYTSDIQLAYQLLPKQDSGLLLPLLQKHLPPPGEEDLRDFEWRHLMWWCEGDRIKTFTDPALPRKPTAKPPTVLGGGYSKGVVSPDGKLLATIDKEYEKSSDPNQVYAVDGKTITLWDAATGKELRVLKVHEGQVTCLAFNRDSTRLASGSRDKTVKIWDTADGKALFTFRGHPNELGALAFFPDGQRIASADNAGNNDNRVNVARIKIWDTKEGKESLTFRVGDILFGNLVASSDGKRLLVIDSASVYVYDADNGKQLIRATNNQFGRPPIAFTPDAKLLASWRGEIWDVAKIDKGDQPFPKPTAKLTYTTMRKDKGESKPVENAFGSFIDYVACAPDGKSLIVASGGAWGWTELSLWDLATGQPKGNYERFSGKKTVRITDEGAEEAFLKNVLNRFPGRAQAMTFTPDGKSLVTVVSQFDSATQVALWDLATGKARVKKAFPVFFNLLNEKIRSASISADESSLIMVCDILNLGGGYQTVTHYDLATGDAWRVAPQRTSPTPPPVPAVATVLPVLKDPRARPEVFSLAMSSDGKTLAVASADHLIRLWNVQGGERPALAGHKGDVYGVAFAPDGKTLASASADGTVKLWDTLAARELSSVTPGKGPVRCVAFAPKEKLLACGTAGRTVQILDYTIPNEAPRLRATLDGHLSDVWSVAFSPDGKTLAVASGTWLAGEIKVWNTTTWKDPVVLSQSTGVRTLAFSPDGTLLANGDYEGNVSLWNAQSLKIEAVLPLRREDGGRNNFFHGDAISSLAFSRNGEWLASASADGLVKLWDRKKQSRAAALWHRGEVRSVVFVRDSGPLLLASGGRDGQVILADLDRGFPTARWQSGSIQTLSRGLSPDGSLLATGDMDSTVLLWDRATGSLRQTLRGQRNQVTTVAFSPDGGVLSALAVPPANLSVTEMNGITWHPVTDRIWQVKLWDTATGKDRGSCEWNGEDSVPLALAVSFRADWAAVSASKAGLALWNVATKERHVLPVDLKRNPLPETGTGKTILQQLGRLLPTDPSNPKKTGTRQKVYQVNFVAGMSYIIDLKKKAGKNKLDPYLRLETPNGEVLAEDDDSGGNQNARIAHRAIQTGSYQVVASHFTPNEMGDFELVVTEIGAAPIGKGAPPSVVATALAFAPDGKTLASASANGEVHLWDVASRTPGISWRAHAGDVRSIAFSVDGKTLATAGGDRTIRLWNVATGRLLLAFANLPGPAESLGFRADGTALTALVGDEVRMWSAAVKMAQDK